MEVAYDAAYNMSYWKSLLWVKVTVEKFVVHTVHVMVDTVTAHYIITLIC